MLIFWRTAAQPLIQPGSILSWLPALLKTGPPAHQRGGISLIIYDFLDPVNEVLLLPVT